MSDDSILSVERYNALEIEGKVKLSNRFLEAFQPEHFNMVGWPTRINKDEEVYKYLDSMHDGRLKLYYDAAMAPVENEFEFIKNLCRDIYEFSRDKFCNGGGGIVLKAPLLCSVNVLRQLSQIFNIIGGNEKPTIFETGGGCGALGAMLHTKAFPYVSTDITQAFYLTQNCLWNGLFPEEVYECTNSLDDLNNIKKSCMLHVPYWKLWELKDSDLEADIMVANHCMSEMHSRSLRFYLQYGKRLMRNSKYKLLFAQSIYNSANNTAANVFKICKEYGYELIYNDRWHYVFALIDQPKKVEINQALVKFNHDMSSAEKVSWNDIEAYYTSYGENIDTPDEAFVHYIGLERI
ncbi:MAG: hypothetical protein IJ520_02210 [Synergistaceae bacterium]|nr:hypothetical protein [Synergistaceae bacterium]